MESKFSDGNGEKRMNWIELNPENNRIGCFYLRRGESTIEDGIEIDVISC